MSTVGSARHLFDVLRERMRAGEAHGGFRFLPDGGVEPEVLGLGDLDRRARAFAGWVQQRCRPGDRVLMLYPPGLGFIEAFYGCLYAGVIAVPAYPPRANRQGIARLAGIARNARPSIVATATSLVPRIRDVVARIPELAGADVHDTDGLEDAAAALWVPPAREPGDVAFVQYTSGSTGRPKGVRITYANLGHNLDQIRRCFRLDDHAPGRAVFWLPPYHDMGLIGGVLEPVLVGYEVSLFSPASFAQRPVRWLEAISSTGAVCSGAPDFAYDLCVRKVRDQDLAGLDLSCWRIAFSGAEPVRASTLDGFAARFGAVGFRREAFLPCYGMAESTLLITAERTDRSPAVRHVDGAALAERRFVRATEGAEARTFVGCGRPVEGGEVRIVDPDSRRELPEAGIGEIWVRSPSVAAGYWEDAPAGRAAFEGRLPGGDEGPFLRTGDLGALVDGALYVVGRAKDMLIVRGRNHYPEDLEASLDRRVSGLVPGAIAVVGVDHAGEEAVAVVAEIDRHAGAEAAEIVARIRKAISHEHDLAVAVVALIRQGSLPRTSSGKRQRHACRQALEQGRLRVVHEWRARHAAVAAADAPSPRQDGEAANGGGQGADLVARARGWIVERVAAELSLPREDVETGEPLEQLGIDSLQAATLVGDLEAWADCDLGVDTLEHCTTIEELARFTAAARQVRDGLGGLAEPQRARLLARLVDEGSTGLPPTAAVPDEWWRVERFPEVVALGSRLAAFEAPGLRRPYFSVHEGPSTVRSRVQGRDVLNYSSNNYLDLATHPDVLEAIGEAVARYGSGAAGSRMVSGEKPIHRELERELADWVGVQDCLAFVGGNTTNVSTIGHLLGPTDLLAHDELSHDSALRGARLAGAAARPFRHGDPASLDELLTRHRRRHRRVLVFIEGLYSMDGDVPDLARFVEVKRRHGALLMVDECLSIGVLGPTGRGLGEASGVPADAVDVWMGGLSKALASCGGYVGGSHELVEYLRYTAPGFIYTTAASPANTAAALAALRVLAREPQRVRRLHELADHFRAEAARQGLDTGLSRGTPVVPVMIPDPEVCLRVHTRLFDRGINVQPIVHPAVPQGASRLRFFLTCAHDEAQIADTVQAVREEWEACGAR